MNIIHNKLNKLKWFKVKFGTMWIYESTFVTVILWNLSENRVFPVKIGMDCKYKIQDFKVLVSTE